MPYPIILNDGTALHATYEVKEWLLSQGFQNSDIETTLPDLLEEYIGEISYEDAFREQEMIADGYASHLSGLIDEVTELANKLLSGKSTKGYTKLDIGVALKKACREYEM